MPRRFYRPRQYGHLGQEVLIILYYIILLFIRVLATLVVHSWCTPRDKSSALSIMDTMHTLLVLLYKLVCILASNIITTVVCRPGVCKRLVCTSSYTTHNAEQVKKSERERGEIDQCTLHSCVMAAASSLFLGRRGWPEGGVFAASVKWTGEDGTGGGRWVSQYPPPMATLLTLRFGQSKWNLWII